MDRRKVWSRFIRLVSVALWILFVGTVLLLALGHGHFPSLEQGKAESKDTSHRPQRVLVTYPGATELLIDLDEAHRIVGTVAPYGVEPPQYKRGYEALPIIDAPYVPSREDVLALKPDMIIAWSHHFTPTYLGDESNWQRRGITTYVVPATIRKGQPTVESTVFPFIDDLGRIFGIEEKAAAYKKSLVNRMNAVLVNAEKRKTMGREPTVLILQAHGHSTYSLYGPIYVIDDIVKKAGGRNLVKHQLSQIGPERVLGFDPDYIVYVYAGDTSGYVPTDEEMKASLMADENLRHMRAVMNGHMIPVAFSDVNNGNGRTITALEKIHNGLSEF